VQVLWTPSEGERAGFEMRRFADRCGFDTYEELQRWSVEDLEGFWQAVWDFYELRAHTPAERVLGAREMPGAEWFPGLTLNYAERMLPEREGVAVVARSNTRGPSELTWGELREQVARARAGLQRLGVQRGDCVVAFLPNIPETLIAFLACASLGAIWASVSPEFGPRSVTDRFAQIEPKVLLAVNGYVYRAAYFDTYPGVWRQGDWVRFSAEGTCIITGRSDATLNRGGIRMGTSELYTVVEEFAQVQDSLVVHLEDDGGGPGELLLFVVAELDEELEARIATALRTQLSPRHVPDTIAAVQAIPRTLTGKKLEAPVKRILRGAAADSVASRGALLDPSAIDAFVQFSEGSRRRK
jgi:acyl-coenzyme A synthetase/AMP-(fatty) acid ligase